MASQFPLVKPNIMMIIYDDDVNEFNNDYVEVQHNNSKDTNTNAEASEETC